ncbi:Uncharacterized protein OBRU01_01581 [Operophtera brumata]|uniref:Uncharacterized protein n=1 Tax=Operophtera brumata TaxID=104452 RepID=A0A0L7LTU9_OPEBR|nr:Uncharacterized protein OBRU01_01581 [Operophtera brumata]
MDQQHPYSEIKGLTSPEIQSDDTIPFFDEVVYTQPKLNEPPTPDIPYANGEPIKPIKPKRLKDFDDKDKIHASDLGEVHKSPNNDTIVVNTPEGTLYITLEPDLAKSKPTSPSKDFTDSIPSTSKAFESKVPGANESEELIQNERDGRKAGLRRNSISMPTLQNLESEVLKQYMNNPQEGPKQT